MTNNSISMKGGGYYSQNTQGAKHVINRAGVHVLKYLERLEISDDCRPFSVIDYGAADGGTSLELISKILQCVRAKNNHREIVVTYTDLPHNDFSALFQIMHNQDPDSLSYLKNNSNVFLSCAGTTFYQQIVASESVDIGFSATAMHWLSGLPGQISDHVHAVGARGQEWKNFKEYAQRDWETILLNRARELVPGGLLVMANFCIDEQGRYLGNTRGANMFDTFDHLWKEMVDIGMITAAEYKSTAFPQFYKTIDQFRAPFDDSDSSVRNAGLRLEEIYTGVTTCPYRANFDQIGDPVTFADAYIPTLRSWSETVFMNGLDRNRTLEERQSIVNQFYQNYNSLVRSDPNEHAMDYVHTYMVIKKI